MAEVGIIDIQTIIFQIFNFFVLLFLLNKFLYEPLMNLLEKRVKKVEEINQKEKDVTEKLSMVETQKAVLIRQAKEDAQKVISEAKSQASELSSKIEFEARKKADQIIDNAKAQAAEQMAQSEKLIEEKVRSMAVEISEELIASNLTEAQRDKIMQSSIKTLDLNG